MEAHGFSRGVKATAQSALAAVAIYPQRLKAFFREHCFPRLKAWASTGKVLLDGPDFWA